MNRPYRGRGNFPRFRGRGGFRPYYRKKGPDENKTENGSQPPKKPVSSQIKITNFTISPSPYPGWKLYFPEEEFTANSMTITKTAAFQKYIHNNGPLFPATTIEESRTCSIDLKILKSDQEFNDSWGDDFENDLLNRPEHTIGCLGLAMHQSILMHLKEEMIDANSENITLPIIRARVFNFEPITQLKQLKSNYYGKLVSVKGTIIRVGTIKLLCTWMTFTCCACQALMCIRQPEGVHTAPTKCDTDGCRSKTFAPLLSSPYTLTVNWQSVRLQETVADDQREGGRVPRTVDCELLADLVDSCSPGDIVTVTGVVKVRNEEETKKKSANVYLMYLEAVSVMNNKINSTAGRAAVEFNIKDYYAIKEIHSEPNLFRLLVHSLCPSIYGHEVVKAGLLLCMFGGSERQVDGRADPHILVVGDPGLGKSRMLQACANVAPRGVYVCGNTSTSSGLTVTLRREGGGDFVMEAGALVLADQGCCCIDEFDKMTNQHQALLEAMEQQTISIAKAGVVCSLPARTSILAAANPVGGHYNKAKTVSENLRLGPALLSRFDLVFILLDKPNEFLDCMLSEHVMALHSGVKSTSAASCSTSVSSRREPTENRGPLQERLKLLQGEELDVIPHQLLRKYIAYARKYVKPRLSPEAAKVLQQFYLTLRQHHKGADSTPVTTRQLESLIRLTQSRAKMELRELATEDDANDTIEIMKTSMVDTWSDEVGAMDLSRSLHGSGMSSRNQAKKFISALQRKSELQGRSMFSVQEMKEVAKMAAVSITDFSGFLSTLNVQGVLLKKGPQLYQLLSAE